MLPKSEIISAEIAADTSNSSSGVDLLADQASSVSSPARRQPEGMFTPMNPASPRTFHSSVHGRRSAELGVVARAELPGYIGGGGQSRCSSFPAKPRP